MNKRGHFFVFEGIDGSGKTTQIHLLQKRIEQQGVRCMETKEPTDGPIGSLLRQCLTGRMNIDEYSISAMFAADRLDHLQNETDGLCHKKAYPSSLTAMFSPTTLTKVSPYL